MSHNAALQALWNWGFKGSMDKLTGALLPARSVMDGRAGGSTEQRHTTEYKGVALATIINIDIDISGCGLPELQLNRHGKRNG